MENNNSTKPQYVILVLLGSALLVFLGLALTGGVSNVQSVGSFSKSEIKSFNSQWEKYKSIQKGSKVMQLLQLLAQNAEEHKEVPEMLVDVAYNTSEESKFTIIYSTVQKPNSVAFTEAASKVNVKHNYMIELLYNLDTGIVKGILIKNNKNDKISFTPDEN